MAAIRTDTQDLPGAPALGTNSKRLHVLVALPRLLTSARIIVDLPAPAAFYRRESGFRARSSSPGDAVARLACDVQQVRTRLLQCASQYREGGALGFVVRLDR
jgi:hypothetical protein